MTLLGTLVLPMAIVTRKLLEARKTGILRLEFQKLYVYYIQSQVRLSMICFYIVEEAEEMENG